MTGIRTPWIINAVCDTLKEYADALETTLNDEPSAEREQQVSDIRQVIDSLAFCIHDDC
jgi:hypothetical protein